VARITVTRALRSMGGFRRVVAVFARHGFGHLLAQMGLGRDLPARNQRGSNDDAPTRLRRAFEELGPAWIKLGQTLSMRPDLIHPEYIEELCKLRDNVATVPFDAVRTQIEESLGGSLEELYLTFDPTPLAAASIGQVHCATLAGAEGEPPIEVVVKVRRPGIRKVVNRDLRVVSLLADLLINYVPESRAYNPPGLVEEFFRTIARELDFRQEASSLREIRANFEGEADCTLVIPEVYRDLSSESVLTMDRLDGVTLSDIETVTTLPCDLKSTADAGGRYLLKMIFEDGVFHGDLHSGNVFIYPDGRIGLIDFGIVGRLDERSRDRIAELMLFLFSGDFERAARLYSEMGSPADPDRTVDISGFGNRLGALWGGLQNKTLRDLNVGELLLESSAAAGRANIMLPQDLMLLFKALLTLESMGNTLDPDFDPGRLIQEHVQGMAARRLSPERLQRDLLGASVDLLTLGREAPPLILRSLRRLGDGAIDHTVTVRRSDDFLNTLGVASNRVASAVVVAGLSIGSAILLAVDVEPFATAVSYLGLAGMLVAGTFGLGLLWSMSHHLGRR
jgi:ubiquinone biosynthesis protein